MLLIIILYFFIIIVGLGLDLMVLASTSAKPRTFGLSLGFGLVYYGTPCFRFTMVYPGTP